MNSTKNLQLNIKQQLDIKNKSEQFKRRVDLFTSFPTHPSVRCPSTSLNNDHSNILKEGSRQTVGLGSPWRRLLWKQPGDGPHLLQLLQLPVHLRQDPGVLSPRPLQLLPLLLPLILLFRLEAQRRPCYGLSHTARLPSAATRPNHQEQDDMEDKLTRQIRVPNEK